MKKIFLFALALLLIFAGALPAFAAEEAAASQAPDVPTAAPVNGLTEGEDVPFIGGALAPEELAPLTDDERQLRLEVYNEILALAETDENITAVKLSESGRWVFWSVVIKSIDPEENLEEWAAAVKGYARKFDGYTFVIMTDDVDAAYDLAVLSGDNYFEAGTGATIGGQPAIDNDYRLWLICTAALLLTGGTFILSRKNKKAPQPAQGNIPFQSTAASKSELISILKKSETPPDDKVFASILQEINN